MTAYNGLCIGHLKVNNDSIFPTAPKGYVLLSYEGARNALKMKAEADACLKSIAMKDSINSYLGMKIRMSDSRTSELIQAVQLYKKETRTLKRKLFFQYIYGVSITLFFGYYITK